MNRIVNLVARTLDCTPELVQSVLVTYYETLLIDLSLRGYVETPLGRLELKNDQVVLVTNSGLVQTYLKGDESIAVIVDNLINAITNT